MFGIKCVQLLVLGVLAISRLVATENQDDKVCDKHLSEFSKALKNRELWAVQSETTIPL